MVTHLKGNAFIKECNLNLQNVAKNMRYNRFFGKEADSMARVRILKEAEMSISYQRRK